MPLTNAVGRNLAVSLVMAATACGSSPAAPSSAIASALPDGRYTLTLTPPAEFQGCTGLAEASVPFLWSQSFFLTIVREQDEWVGRSQSGPGDNLVVRLRETPVGSRRTSGAIQGTGVVAQGLFGEIGIGVLVEAPAPLSGTILAPASVAEGLLSGPIVFIRSSRDRMTCPTAQWLLR